MEMIICFSTDKSYNLRDVKSLRLRRVLLEVQETCKQILQAFSLNVI